MWKIETLSFIAGILLLFVALIGGGFKIKEIEVPKVGSIFRILSAIVGIVLLILGIGLYENNRDQLSKANTEIPETASQIQSQAEAEPEKVYCPDCKVWNFHWETAGSQYEALLVFNPLKGYGKMRVKYYKENVLKLIQEEINQVSTGSGQYLAGKNPFDAETFQPVLSYVPDNVIMDGQTISVFDPNGTYPATFIPINDVDAIIKVFGFNYTDLDF